MTSRHRQDEVARRDEAMYGARRYRDDVMRMHEWLRRTKEAVTSSSSTSCDVINDADSMADLKERAERLSRHGSKIDTGLNFFVFILIF